MALTNCSRCQYFNHNPNHQGDIVCSLNPAYASMWQSLNSLDQYTKGCLPVDDCREFELDLAYLEQEITLSLTFAQWQQTAYESSNPSLTNALTKALRDIVIEKKINLTQSQWQTLANSCSIPQVLFQLAQQGVEPDPEIKQWIEVDSECIEAIAFDNSTHSLKIRFVSDLVYEYDCVTSTIFEQFCNASSKGRFFNQRIKDAYAYRLLS